MLLIKASATVEPSYLPGINSMSIMCIGIINPHMPIGKVWIHLLLFVCLFEYVCFDGYGFFRQG